MKMWDLDTFECVKTLNGHTDSVLCVDKYTLRVFLSGSSDESKDKAIKIWNLTTGQCIKTLVGHN